MLEGWQHDTCLHKSLINIASRLKNEAIFTQIQMAAFVTGFPRGTANTFRARSPRISRFLGRPQTPKQQWIFSPSCRMRNREGFQLPPRVPSDPTKRRRAVELLGCCTQRKHMLPKTATELESLIGQIPPSRLLAQQWKGALQRDMERAKRKRAPTAFKHREHLKQTLKLSERNAAVSRCFILLAAVRRRYLANESPNPKSLNELNEILGTFPKTSIEAHRFIQALSRMQRERRISEKRPPRIPAECISDLTQASMLLERYAARSSIGRQTDELEAFIGAIPRNRNVARSWQKLINAAIRKIKRRERKEVRRREIEQKRFERQLRKLRRKHLTTVETQSACSCSPPNHYIALQHAYSLKLQNGESDHVNERKGRSFIAKVSQFLFKLRGEQG